MAAVRYRAEQAAFHGKEYTVEIWDADYADDVVEFTVVGDTGFEQRMLGEGRERTNEVVGSELSFRMDMATPDHELFITDLLSSREGRFTVRAYDSLTDRLFWAGVVLSDSSGYPDASPYHFEVVAADGLAALKDVKYTQSDGMPYTGVVSLVEHVLNCLNKLDYVAVHYAASTDPLLAVSVDWFEVEMDSGPDDDPMYQAGVDHAVFYKFDGNGQDFYSCHDVLTFIMRTTGARIFRVDTSFHIDQLTYRTGTMQVRRYAPDGTVLVTGVLGGDNDIDQTDVGALEATGNYTSFPPLSAVKVTFEAKERRNFVAGWQSGTTLAPQSATISASGDNSVLRFSATLQVHVFNNNLTQWDQNPLYLEYRMTLKVGGRWAKRTYQMQNFQIQYTDITWETSAQTVSYVVPFNFPAPGTNASALYNIDIMLPPLEASGAYEFDFAFHRVHNKNNSTITITGTPLPQATVTNNFSNSWLEVFTFGFSAQYPDELLYEATNNEATNTAVQEIKTILGDSDNPNTVGRLQVRDGLGGWTDSTYWGDGTNDRDLRIGELLAKLVLAGQTVPVRKLQGSFFGSGIDLRRVYAWDGATWVMLGGTWESQTGTVRGEFVELKYAPGSVSVSPVKLILHQSPSTSLPNSPSSGGSASGLALPPSLMTIPAGSILAPLANNTTGLVVAPGPITSVTVAESLTAGEYQIGDELSVVNPVTGQAEVLTVTAASLNGDTAIAVSGTLTGTYPDGSFLIRNDVRIPSGLQGQILRKGATKWEGYGDASMVDYQVLTWTDAGGWAAATQLLPIGTTAGANQIYAGPTSGGAATPTFRALVAADIPNLDTSKLTTGTLPIARGGTGLSALGTALQLLRVNSGATALEFFTLTLPTGTVTSVALSLPASLFSVSGSPVTSSGTLTAALITQLANLIFAGPGSGGAAAPTFRALVAADIPNLDTSKLTTGTLPIARGGTGLSALGTALQLLRVNSGATALEFFTLTAVTGAGVAGQVMVWTGTNTAGGFVSLLYDSTNGRLQINTTGTPVAATAHYEARPASGANDIFLKYTGNMQEVLSSIANTRNTGSSGSNILELLVGGANGGDVFLRLGVSGVNEWVVGIDNSAADVLRILNRSDPSSGDPAGEGIMIGTGLVTRMGINKTALGSEAVLDIGGPIRGEMYKHVNLGASIATFSTGSGMGTGGSIDALNTIWHGNGGYCRFTLGSSPAANAIVFSVAIQSGYRLSRAAPIVQGRILNSALAGWFASYDNTTGILTVSYAGTLPAGVHWVNILAFG
jgi:hypothetical protein